MSDSNFSGSLGCDTHLRIGTGTDTTRIGAKGGSLTVNENFYAPGLYPGVASTHPLPFSGGTGTVGSANAARTVRMTIPFSGTIVDFSIFIVTTASGNVDGGIYSTAATRAKLWSNGGTAIGGSAAWQSLGTPNLVVRVGEQYDLAVAMDTITTVVMATQTLQSSAMGTLPSGYLPGVAASPKICGTASTSYPLPATIAEGTLTTSSLVPLIVMRIV